MDNSTLVKQANRNPHKTSYLKHTKKNKKYSVRFLNKYEMKIERLKPKARQHNLLRRALQ